MNSLAVLKAQSYKFTDLYLRLIMSDIRLGNTPMTIAMINQNNRMRMDLNETEEEIIWHLQCLLHTDDDDENQGWYD